jgi:hypothetical protein
VLGAAICIAALALLQDLLLALVQRVLTPRGAKLEASARQLEAIGPPLVETV